MRAGHFLGLLLLGAGIAVVQPKNAPTIKGKIYFVFFAKVFPFVQIIEYINSFS